MKKLLLTTVPLALMLLIISCSTDEASVNNSTTADASNSAFSTQRGTFWGGAIAQINNDGTTTITADVPTILSDLEDILAREGNATTLSAVRVVKKVNVNNTQDATYALVGTNSTGISIGVFLAASSDYLYLDNGYGGTGANEIYSTSCRGCADGCNLMYITVGGKKVFYCDENVCGNFCSKNETTSTFTHAGG